MNEKTIQCFPNPSQHVPIYLQQFPSYSNRKCKKIAFFTYRSPHFCFPWRRPCDYHAICCMDGKAIQCLPNAMQHVLSIFHSFRVIRCLSQCVSPKIAIFTTFWFPWGRPGEITLNVVWMEREFDASRLFRWMCPSKYNRFSDRVRYWSKIVIFFIPPLHSTPPLGGFRSEYHHPVWCEKTRIVWLLSPSFWVSRTTR